MSGALDGVRVIDLTAVLMGPFATQLLGDMGADVIKVESPTGDTSRGIGPMRNPGMGGTFLHVNRNKRSLVLDLKQAPGLAAFLRLVETADVLLFNIRPLAMARLGLTWETLAALNPRLIYVGIFGYGQRGPYAAKPAYDDLIQGAMGLPTLVAQVGDGVPRYVPIAIVDRTVGMAAVNAVCAALYRREKTGCGQAIEVPMFETMLPYMLGEHMGGQTFVPPAGPTGYPRLMSRERTPFPTKDGYLSALIYTDQHWQDFFAMLGEPARYANDPRLATMSTRTQHITELYAMVAEILRTKTTEEWVALFDTADIPAIRMNSLDSLFTDPHLQAIGFFTEADHPTEGRVMEIGHAATWSESPLATTRMAPRLGEHSAEILTELKFSADEIADMARRGITALTPHREK